MLSYSVALVSETSPEEVFERVNSMEKLSRYDTEFEDLRIRR